jgi:hypothetical protein
MDLAALEVAYPAEPAGTADFPLAAVAEHALVGAAGGSAPTTLAAVLAAAATRLAPAAAAAGRRPRVALVLGRNLL